MISGIEDLNVYLSGPMTGCEDWNREAFAEVERECIASGAAAVYNPAARAPHGDDPHPHYHGMRVSAHELTKPDGLGLQYYDFILMLPGWKKSMGARFERQVAIMCGIEIKEVK